MQTRISAKGQVVLPKAARDALDWHVGQRLEVVKHPGGLTLRAIPDRSHAKESAEAILARIAARNTYRGPKITDEDMHDAVQEIAAQQDKASRQR